MLDIEAPRLDAAGAVRIAAKGWGLEATATPLTGDGGPYVLKSQVAADPWTDLESQNRLLAHLATGDLGVRTPRVVPARDGREIVPVETGEGPGAARLLTHLPGRRWAETGGSPELRRELGRVLARLNRHLAAFDHAALHRDHPWDLRRAGRQRRDLAVITDPTRRRLVETVFHRFAAYRTLHGPSLRRSIIHGDANDHNLLVENGRLTGLLDVGDAVASWTIAELAIALAYVMLDEEDPLAAASEVARAYHAEWPLTDEELTVLFPFACARLAQSVVISARRRHEEREDGYLYVSEAPAWALLERLAGVDPATAQDRLRQACGVTAMAMAMAMTETETARAAGRALLTARRERIGPSLSLAYDRPLHVVRGLGQYLYAADGRPYLDLVNNVCHVGHCHPAVVAAAARQMGTLNTNTRYLYDGLTAYAERLTATLPAGLDVCFFVNSGSEANELAIRLARAATGRRDLLVLDGAYHGHTTSLVEASPYKFMGKGGSGRAADWVHVAPMPDGYRGRHRGHGAETGRRYTAEIEHSIAASPRPLAGFLCEPILGCGGQIVPPEGFLAGAYEAIRRAGGLAIADEVQVGFGRAGSHFWAFETEGVVPDVVVMGKPIGNGHPLAAVVTTRAIADAFANGMEFFATFGGNPVSCAVGMAVLDVVEDENLQARAAELGERMLTGLRELAKRYPLVGDVRGVGLFAGVELVRDHETLEPATEEAAAIVGRLARRGLLLSTDGPFANVIKIKPPMVLTADDVDFFVRELDAELETVA